jgi:hypothetical protein
MFGSKRVCTPMTSLKYFPLPVCSFIVIGSELSYVMEVKHFVRVEVEVCCMVLGGCNLPNEKVAVGFSSLEILT